ncbi:FAD-binding oxidoreductase [Catenulispora pinisilvae]|uniref:FAD-binding oxidoreductase n=1 Tax=Catenulispora pinisilvae TaxID=2705253 RepID=UPI001890CEA5|nr:FAD-linked oxidase C-terminal domain-containing protein [Catenulispora pinisilvae]
MDKIPPAAVSDLRALLGDRVLTEPGALAAYGRDATPLFRHAPDVVVQPLTTEEVAGVMRIATRYRVPVTTRGAGTNLCAATVPLSGGIVLSTTRMTALLEVSRDEMLTVCQPGVTAGALNLAAGTEGLIYVPDPGSKEASTVGGNVATCAGGLRGLKYGVTRQYVLGLEAVLPDGEVIRTGGRLVKDVAGYDLTRLLVGSEGTLAVITEITMALVPKPAAARYGVAYFESMTDASVAVRDIVASGPAPATLEFMDAVCIAAVEDFAHLGLRLDAGALLLFGDDGEPDAVDRSLARMASVCGERATHIELAASVAAAEDLLAARRCNLPALARSGSMTILEDVTVPRPKLAEMVAFVAATAEKHGVRIGTFGHAGDGNLHPTAVVDADDPAATAAAVAAFDDIFRHAVDLGGTITGEHGVGAAKLPYLEHRLGPEQMALLRRIKGAFDPLGLLNPGKLGS